MFVKRMQNCKMASTAEIVIGLLFITTGLVNHVQSQSIYDVRLADGDQYNNGRVEIFYNDEWVTVCDHNWSDYEARIVCHQLGHNSGNPVVKKNAYYGPGSGSSYDVDCFLKSNLSACSFVEGNPIICSHHDDVGVKCESQYDVRLADGSLYNNGRVEIFYNAEWVTVCDVNWSDRDAQIVCRQLGYDSGNAVVKNNAYYGPGSGSIYNVDCSFSGSNLSACSFVEASPSRCTHNDDVGVHCESQYDVRLVDGSIYNNGRVEIFYNAEWVTVCDHNWSDHEAQIVCRQLRHNSGNPVVKNNAYYGPGSGSIYNVDCLSGSHLSECSFVEASSDICTHNDDVGVHCESQYDVRLADSVIYNRGRVEIFYNAEWVTVCDVNWGADEAQIVCGQLGYDSGNPVVKNNAYYGLGSGSIYNVDCSISGSNLSACSFVEASSSRCTHNDDAGVECESQYDVRLADGDQYNNGRVEIFQHGEWVTVCDHNWGDDDAQIVCHQLGHNPWNAVVKNNSYYGPGSGISIYSVVCQRHASRLSECSFSQIFAPYCNLNDNVGVQCGDEPTTASPSSPSTSDCLAGGASALEGRVEIYCLFTFLYLLI